MYWWIDVTGYFAAALTTAAFAPQVWKSWRSRSVRDLSAAMILAMCGGTASWFVYGLAVGSGPLVVANGITFLLCAALGAMKLRGAPAAALATAASAAPLATLAASARSPLVEIKS